MNRDDLAARGVRVKALIEAYWKLRSYAVHDDDCTRNKPPRFRNCSCGLTAAIKAGERAADLLDVAEEGPSEYERKVAQPQGALMIEAIAQQAARDARDVFSDHPVAKEAVDYMEQLIYAATPAALAASPEVQAMIREAEARGMERAAAYHDTEIAGLEKQIEENNEYLRRCHGEAGAYAHASEANDHCRTNITAHRISAAAIRAEAAALKGETT